MASYFIADLHIDDKNIMTYEHRPFSSVQDMNDTIRRNWNNVVSSKDTVYILGDIGNPEFLSNVKGKKIIVTGNHDNLDALNGLKNNTNIWHNIIQVISYPIMVDGLWLSHEPIGYMPPECPYLNVHGHLHRFNYGLLQRKWEDGNRYFCVSVEQIDYTPISREGIASIMGYESSV